MQSVEFEGIAELDERFARALKAFPEKRREFHERMAERLEREVRQQIYMSGINSSSGKIEGWQVSRVGTRGGYAAVSAVGGRSGRNSPGAITNYLENGHRIRPPGKTKPRARVPYVNGFHFYKYTRENAPAIAANEAQKLLAEMARVLEGAA